MNVTNTKYRGVNGVEQFYSNSFYKKYKYSNNIRDIFLEQNCYWLLDCILSYQFEKKFKEAPFQVWTLEREFENEKTTNIFNLICTVKIHNEQEESFINIAEQNIPYSYFIDDKLIIWLIDDVLILHEEY